MDLMEAAMSAIQNKLIHVPVAQIHHQIRFGTFRHRQSNLHQPELIVLTLWWARMDLMEAAMSAIQNKLIHVPESSVSLMFLVYIYYICNTDIIRANKMRCRFTDNNVTHKCLFYINVMTLEQLTVSSLMRYIRRSQ